MLAPYQYTLTPEVIRLHGQVEIAKASGLTSVLWYFQGLLDARMELELKQQCIEVRLSMQRNCANMKREEGDM